MNEGLITVLHDSVFSSYLDDAQQAMIGSNLQPFLRGQEVLYGINPDFALDSENLKSPIFFLV